MGYADTTFLVSCYVKDANSARAASLIADQKDSLPWTGLHRLEFRNALQLRIFRREMLKDDVERVWRRVEQDLETRRLVDLPVDWAAVLRVAESLAEQHSAAFGTRSLDVLHVATARCLRAANFLTFDNRQASLARELGFAVAA